MRLAREPKVPRVDGLTFSEAEFDDGVGLEALFDEAREQVELLTGDPMLPAEVQSLYIALPSGSTYDDKALLVGRARDEEGEIVVVVDVVRDHPDVGTWWIGFILVKPRRQRNGLGRLVLDGVLRWVGSHDGRRVCLKCPHEPPHLRSFFVSSGFRVTDDGGSEWLMTAATREHD